MFFCQQLFVDEAVAQTDSVTLVLHNIPVKSCSDFRDFKTSKANCDTNELFSFNESFLLGSIRHLSDTIEYSFYKIDTIYEPANSRVIDSTKCNLLIVFPTADSSIANISLNSNTYSRTETVFFSVYQLTHSVNFSIEGVTFFRVGRMLSESLGGDKILDRHLYFNSDSNNYSTSESDGDTYWHSSDSALGRVGASSSITINLSTQAILGVSSNAVLSDMILHVFPNPSSNSISITTQKSTPELLSVFDQLGQRVAVFDNVTLDQPFQMNVSAFPCGVYRVRVGDKMEKFIVQH